jgi:membrane protease YdiL (CAAX protease family)
MQPVPNFPALTARTSVSYWFGAFLLGNIAALVAVVAVWRPDSADEPVPMRATTVSAVVMWAVFLLFLRMLTRGLGSGSWRHDYGLAFRAVDVPAGIALGLLGQFVIAPLVNLPLTRLFPDSFDTEEIERRARELTDSATGAWVIALVLIVVVAAPVVEELMYRGLLQQGLSNSLGATKAWLIAAAVFAAIHLQPIEFPGLFAFALLLGWIHRRTGRLGMCIVTHMSFNACGLLLVSLLN